jgi:hypothetical protein
MGATQLKRKAARNKSRVVERNTAIKVLTAKPVIKKVTAEEIKEQFK